MIFLTYYEQGLLSVDYIYFGPIGEKKKEKKTICGFWRLSEQKYKFICCTKFFNINKILNFEIQTQLSGNCF